MHEWVKSLLELQKLDMRVGSIDEELALIPEKQSKTRQLYAEKNAAYDEANKSVQTTELSIRKIESEIAALVDQKHNFQSKSALIKNNDEYRAAMLQIEMCDHSIADGETRQLQAMDALDGAKKVLEEKKQILAAAKKESDAMCAELDKQKAAIEKEKAELLAGRPALAANVEPDVLERYERICMGKRHKASKPAAVPVNDGTCGNCRISVTKQIVTNAKNGKKICCDSCGSILYYADED